MALGYGNSPSIYKFGNGPGQDGSYSDNDVTIGGIGGVIKLGRSLEI